MILCLPAPPMTVGVLVRHREYARGARSQEMVYSCQVGDGPRQLQGAMEGAVGQAQQRKRAQLSQMPTMAMVCLA